MSRALVGPTTLTIALNANASDELPGGERAHSYAIFSPAGPYTGTVTVEGCPTEGGTDWYTLQSGGADVTIAASKVTEIFPVTFAKLRLKSSANEAAARAFQVTVRTPA